jgi:hypothetical protein
MLEIRRNLPSRVDKAKEHFAICDLPGFAEFCDGLPDGKRRKAGTWTGGMGFVESLQCVRKGDMTGVAPSDRFMGQIESMIPATAAWRTIDSVVGGAPIVPAFIAGHPLSMRQRQRTAVETAPLSVFAELVSSADISAKDMAKRGAAILALVRALSAVRPVELWAILAIGQGGVRATACVRLDTSPLDLARAAHVLTHPSVPRALAYPVIQERLLDGVWNGGWAFYDVDKHRATARDTYRDALNPGSETLYVPPVYSADESIRAPVEWLKKHLAQYGGLELA